MRDHDLDPDPTAARPTRSTDAEHDGGPEIERSLRAGRPEPLGPQGLLRLQRLAGNAGVQRLVEGHEHGAEEHAEEGERSPVHRVVELAGEPLEPVARSSMELALGRDFGDVRIHRDGEAAASARSVQAHAYTVGNHVVFGEGRYSPTTDEGRRTLAHELTHVVQQREGPVEGTPAPGGIRVSDPSDRFEREAEQRAGAVVAPGADSAPPAPSAGASLQRQDDEGAAATSSVVQRQATEAEEEEQLEEPAAAPPAPEQAGTEGAEPAPPSEAPAEEPEEEREETPG